jgi:hypothetical protein
MTVATKQTKQQTVLDELAEQQTRLARVKHRETTLIEERRRLGSQKPPQGLIGAAVEQRHAARAAAVRDDTAVDLKAIDAEIQRLEDRADDLRGELTACADVIKELAEQRRHTLIDPDRHEQLMALAWEKAAEGEALIATAAAAAADLEQHRGEVLDFVNLGVTGSSGEIDERRAAAARFTPWVVPRDGDGRTPIDNLLPAYWSALARIAAGPPQ